MGKCQHCVYWELGQGMRDDNGKQVGKCRRYPPTVAFTQASVHMIFPGTTPDDGCGEHKDNRH